MNNVNAVVDALGARLATITGLRVYDYVPETVEIPAVVVAYPELRYDSTYARGADEATFSITVLVSRAIDRVARDTVEAYRAPTGAKSIKAAVDGNLGGTVADARVASSKVETVEVGGVAYLSATFTVEVFG